MNPAKKDYNIFYIDIHIKKFIYKRELNIC